MGVTIRISVTKECDTCLLDISKMLGLKKHELASLIIEKKFAGKLISKVDSFKTLKSDIKKEANTLINQSIDDVLFEDELPIEKNAHFLMFQSLFEPGEFMPNSELYEKVSQYGSYSKGLIGRLIKQCGIKQHIKKINGKTVRGYFVKLRDNVQREGELQASAGEELAL